MNRFIILAKIWISTVFNDNNTFQLTDGSSDDTCCSIANCTAPDAQKICPTQCSKIYFSFYGIYHYIVVYFRSITLTNLTIVILIICSWPKMLCRFWLCRRCLGKCRKPLGSWKKFHQTTGSIHLDITRWRTSVCCSI